MTIKEMRTATGWTQKTFADYFNIPARTLQDWENGKSNCPVYLQSLIEYKLFHEILEERKAILNANERDTLITKLNNLKKELDDITDDIFDDGSYDGDREQNRRFAYECQKIGNIGESLAYISINGLTEQDLNKLWKDCWRGGNQHLPEERMNHHIRYISELLEFIKNDKVIIGLR